ncbi:hypothetical protein ES703_08372 [subsurface metagenome]
MDRLAHPKQAESQLDRVYDTIEDYIFENHRFCSLDEISRAVGKSRPTCGKLLEQLVKSDRIRVVFEGKGNPTIYVPTYMLQEILRTQCKPRWVDKYSFREKKDGLKQMREATKGIEQYERFERLLYGTSTPLEEVVAYALEYLEFLNVKHHKDEDIQDVSFSYDTKKYLLEIAGTTKQGDVKKVSQLHRWVRNQVDEGSDPKDILGIFVVNHFRHLDLDKRGDPLTAHARRYLKMYGFKFFTTAFLFDMAKKVHTRNIAKDEAQRLVVKGQKIS